MISKCQYKNTFNNWKSNVASTEPSDPIISKPELSNATETQEMNLQLPHEDNSGS